MRPAWSRKWLTLALIAPLWLISPALSVRPAAAQGGGTLVVGLDQEPPTLDPHASPSAVTYQVIASVGRTCSTGGPTASSCPGSPSRGPSRATAAA